MVSISGLSAASRCLSSSSTTKLGSYTDEENSSPTWMAPLFNPETVSGPPKSSFLTCLKTIPYVFFRPIWQNGFVGQSGGAPNTNWLAIVPPPPALPPDPPPHAAPRSASDSRAAPRAYLRLCRMGNLPSFLGCPPPRHGPGDDISPLLQRTGLSR